MFEYDNKVLRLIGFNNIVYIDKERIVVEYKNKKIIINGSELKANNLVDRSLDIEGIIDSINMEYNYD